MTALLMSKPPRARATGSAISYFENNRMSGSHSEISPRKGSKSDWPTAKSASGAWGSDEANTTSMGEPVRGGKFAPAPRRSSSRRSASHSSIAPAMSAWWLAMAAARPSRSALPAKPP